MTSNAVGVLIFLAVFGIVSSNPDGGVDCRKFVFAPLCRGVAAKRGHYEPAEFVDDDSDKHLLGSLRAALDLLEQHGEEGQLRTNRQNKIENPLKMYQQEPTNRFLIFLKPAERFLFGNRRSNSERDNFPAQDFENL